MKRHMACILMLTGAWAATSSTAYAQTPVNLGVGEAVCIEQFCIGMLKGGGSLAPSDLLVNSLDITNIDVQGVYPSALTDTEWMSVSTPIQSLTGTFNRSTEWFVAKEVRILGGVAMTAPATLPSGKKNAASTGGSLSLTDIRVDLTNPSIYATLTGANGVGTRPNQLIWTYGAIEGATSFHIPPGDFYANNKLSQLTLTTEAFDLFAQSLGLTAFGKSAMAGIEDYGVMNTTIKLRLPMAPPAIPEPATYMLMALGLLGVAATAHRSRHNHTRG